MDYCSYCSIEAIAKLVESLWEDNNKNVRALLSIFNKDDIENMELNPKILIEVLNDNTVYDSLSLISRNIECEADVEYEAIMAIGNALQNNQYITYLNLGNNNIGNKGAIAIANALQFNKHIIHLDLFGNDIGDEGAIALANLLINNNTITGLDLDFNNIGYNGILAITNALSYNNHFSYLNLADNNIGDDEAIAISKILLHNNHIDDLRLANNDIADKGIIAISKALAYNHLRYLDFRGNNMEAEGMAAIAKALLYNTSLLVCLTDCVTNITKYVNAKLAINNVNNKTRNARLGTLLPAVEKDLSIQEYYIY